MGKKLEALNPFSGEEGFLRRGDRFETSEARANLLLKAKLVKELAEDAEVTESPKQQATLAGKSKAQVVTTKPTATKPA